MNLLKNIWVRGIIIICILIGGFFFLQSYNQVEKPTLVNTQGRAFEKATVVEVLKDNIQAHSYTHLKLPTIRLV